MEKWEVKPTEPSLTFLKQLITQNITFILFSQLYSVFTIG